MGVGGELNQMANLTRCLISSEVEMCCGPVLVGLANKITLARMPAAY
jgi:hypothetical protein